MGRIPDRWENYSALGKVVAGTRFLPFKVPLKEWLCQQSHLPKDRWFTPKILIDTLQSCGTHLGLVIDLTNTDRYYSAVEITEQDIGYEKIRTEGHAVPSATIKQRFFSAVDKFLTENNSNDLIIGVHCTHGLNRTGYLVCRYMVDKLRIEPADAIRAFNEARGYEIERDNYLDDLLSVSRTTGAPSRLVEVVTSRVDCYQQPAHQYPNHRSADDGHQRRQQRHHQQQNSLTPASRDRLPPGRSFNYFRHREIAGPDRNRCVVGNAFHRYNPVNDYHSSARYSDWSRRPHDYFTDRNFARHQRLHDCERNYNWRK